MTAPTRPAVGDELERLLAADERAQALVLLAAGGAAVEVRPQPGRRGVRVLARELELDVAVELGEARAAGAASRPRRSHAAASPGARFARPARPARVRCSRRGSTSPARAGPRGP